MHVCMSEANFTEVCLLNILGKWRNLWVIIKATHSPEVDLSAVNISILINTLQAILVHSDPTSLNVIHTEFGERLWSLTMKGGGRVCVCV